MKYKLVGINGNAFAVMGYVRDAMKKEGCSFEEKKAYTEDAMSGDYSHLLCVSINMIEKLNEKRQDEFSDDNEDEYNDEYEEDDEDEDDDEEIDEDE